MFCETGVWASGVAFRIFVNIKSAISYGMFISIWEIICEHTVIEDQEQLLGKPLHLNSHSKTINICTKF